MTFLPPRIWHRRLAHGALDHVIRYLGRYTHRVAIANSRLVNVTDELVTFRTKNGKTASIHPLEFLKRFVQHVLPPGFVKIRHYGLYAASHVHSHLVGARRLLSPIKPFNLPDVPRAAASCLDVLRAFTGRDARRCPLCGREMIRPAPLAPIARAPP